jgi:hypothetical protein
MSEMKESEGEGMEQGRKEKKRGMKKSRGKGEDMMRLSRLRA